MATWLIEVKPDYDKAKLIQLFLEEFKVSPYEVTMLESLPERPLKIEETRAVLKKLHLKPTIGKKRAFLILGADNISQALANTLLKTLEEPPSYLEICLVVQNPKRLPPTVLSRSQPLKLKEEKSFKETIKIPKPAEAGTSLVSLLKLPIDELFGLAEKISKEKLTVDYLIRWIEEIKKDLDKDGDVYKLKIFRLLVSNLKLVENSNLNQRLLLENLFLKLKTMVHPNLPE